MTQNKTEVLTRECSFVVPVSLSHKISVLTRTKSLEYDFISKSYGNSLSTSEI